MSDFWVFGYGSLIWKPGFEFIAEEKAVLPGWHRALCVHSWVHRGTREKPGLVLGLKGGGECEGMARLVSADKRDPVIAYLRERELVTDVYIERWADIRLESGQSVKALIYVADENHEQFAPDMPMNILARTILGANGKAGANVEYVVNTVASLKSLGITDHRLEELVTRLKSKH